MITEQQRRHLAERLAEWERSGARERPAFDFPVAEVCPVEDIGVDGYVQCLHPRSHDCPESVPFGKGYFCRCPERVRLKKQFGI